MGNIICCSPCLKNNEKSIDCYDDEDHDHDDYDYDYKTVVSRRSSWGDEDVWHDALMEHDYFGEEIFDVSDEEMDTIQNHLATNFPASEVDYMGDAYIRSVASKPYSKDMSIRRPLEVRTILLKHTSYILYIIPYSIQYSTRNVMCTLFLA
jgi:hypothetical protein